MCFFGKRIVKNMQYNFHHLTYQSRFIIVQNI